MIGEKFHYLTVIEQDLTKPKGNRFWICQCVCGNKTSVKTADLRSGNTKSCGCYKAIAGREYNTKHGECRSKLYNVWNSMKSRCYNPQTDRYSNYGGRGITVCEEWLHNYPAFRDWALANGYKDGLTIDRVNVDRGYSPDNCRWISKQEQMNNTTCNRFLTLNGETHTVADWARLLGISQNVIYHRLSRGWSEERTLTEPPKVRVTL